MRTCTKCKKELPLSKFNGKRKQCYSCRYNPEYDRIKQLRKYGLTMQDYDKMYNDQLGACKICKNKHDVLHVDHCHTTGVVRGLLCNKCNRTLGFVNDDPEILQAMIEYLKR